MRSGRSGARMVARTLAVTCAFFVWPASLAAQRLVVLEPAGTGDAAAPASPASAGGAFLWSTLIPGAGQYRLGAGRWVAYAGVEAWAWLSYLERRDRAERLEGRYRDLAWSVARRIGSGERREREFEYYEAMSQYRESGAYDADPSAAGLQPEADSTTYNGSVWTLARAIFIPSGGDTLGAAPSAEAAALAYYRDNAIEPAFSWSWRGNPLEHEVFAGLIRRSDEVARAATTALGIVLANHVVSAIDALVTARLQGDDARESRPSVRMMPYLPHAREAGPALQIVLPIP